MEEEIKVGHLVPQAATQLLKNQLKSRTLVGIKIRKDRSVLFGFGEKLTAGTPFLDDEYQVDIGTYSAGWRVFQDCEILIGKEDLDLDFQATISNKILQEKLTLCDICQPTIHDAIFHFSKGYRLEFLSLTGEKDCLVFAFCPDNLLLKFSPTFGWRTGPSNKPWNE